MTSKKMKVKVTFSTLYPLRKLFFRDFLLIMFSSFLLHIAGKVNIRRTVYGHERSFEKEKDDLWILVIITTLWVERNIKFIENQPSLLLAYSHIYLITHRSLFSVTLVLRIFISKIFFHDHSVFSVVVVSI